MYKAPTGSGSAEYEACRLFFPYTYPYFLIPHTDDDLSKLRESETVLPSLHSTDKGL